MKNVQIVDINMICRQISLEIKFLFYFFSYAIAVLGLLSSDIILLLSSWKKKKLLLYFWIGTILFWLSLFIPHTVGQEHLIIIVIWYDKLWLIQKFLIVIKYHVTVYYNMIISYLSQSYTTQRLFRFIFITYRVKYFNI